MKKMIMTSLAAACLLNGFALAASCFSRQDSKTLWARAVKFDESRDVVMAVECMNIAANKGHADAQYTLATWYRYGINTLPKDNDQVRVWLEKSAKNGHLDAQCELGIWLLNLGEKASAIEYLTRAAAADHEMAICALEGLKEVHERSIDELLKCLLKTPHFLACQMIAEIKQCEPSKIFQQAYYLRLVEVENRLAYIKSVMPKIH